MDMELHWHYSSKTKRKRQLFTGEEGQMERGYVMLPIQSLGFILASFIKKKNIYIYIYRERERELCLKFDAKSVFIRKIFKMFENVEPYCNIFHL